MVLPGTELGPLLPDIAEEVGFGPLPVIAPATHDTASAVVAVPSLDGHVYFDPTVPVETASWGNIKNLYR